MIPQASGHAQSRCWERLGFILSPERLQFIFDKIKDGTARWTHNCPRGNGVYELDGMTIIWDHSIETLVTFWEIQPA